MKPYRPLRVVEDETLHVIIIYRDKLPEDFQRKLHSFINTRAASLKKRRVVLHIFTDKPIPLGLEDVRDILLSNVHLTISARIYKLDKQMVLSLMREVESSGGVKYVFITRDLVSEYRDVVHELVEG